MDTGRFDAWTKTLAAGQSRRAMLRRLGGGLAGALAVAFGSTAAAAPPDHAGKPQGRCPDGYTNCRGTCVDLTDHPNHCGACNLECSPHEVCCRGACTDPTAFLADPANCGACGHTCAAGELCCGGVCVSAESKDHCGGCGIQCSASQICFNGGCCIIPGPGSNVACTEDSDCCGDEPVCCGTCVFLSTDNQHCGGCGIECDTAAHQICFNGGCCGGAGAACTTDADCCITSCVDGTCESFQ